MDTKLQSGPRRIADKMEDADFVKSLPTSRSEALRIGAKQYMGADCKKGHYSYRVTANGSCAMCTSDFGKDRRNGMPSRKAALAKWNSSEKAKTAKDRWKERDPKWAWVVSVVGGARTRAKYKKLDFNITNEYIYSIAADCCPVLGMAFSYGGTGVMVPESASLDRIDPTKGYVVGNVAVVSFKANAIKSNASWQEVDAVARWLRSVSQTC